MRDDPEYWDALTTRIMATIRQRRDTSWLRPAIWAPPLAAAAMLTLLIAHGRGAPLKERAPSIATMLVSEVQPPNIGALLGARP